MRESVIYQSILREGFEIGFQQGLLEAQAHLLKVIRRLLTRRLGGLEPEFEGEHPVFTKIVTLTPLTPLSQGGRGGKNKEFSPLPLWERGWG